jgi:hypothetical protein
MDSTHQERIHDDPGSFSAHSAPYRRKITISAESGDGSLDPRPRATEEKVNFGGIRPFIDGMFIAFVDPEFMSCAFHSLDH